MKRAFLHWRCLRIKSFTCNNNDVGRPTILLLPITTALLPAILTPDLINNSMQAFGVQGINNGSLPLRASSPILIGWKPSTSFSRHTASKSFSSSRCCLNHFATNQSQYSSKSWTCVPIFIYLTICYECTSESDRSTCYSEK